MNTKPTRYVIVACLMLMLPHVSIGLEFGDAAPPWKVAKWIKGSPVTVKPGTNIYVLYFFETTCHYCQESTPFLNDLKKRYKNHGLIPCGISYEPTNVVERYIDSFRNEINYPIAIDDSRQTYASYMQATRIVSFPYAFVINTNGILVWHGNPLGGLDEVIDELVGGRFLLEEWKSVAKARHLFDVYLQMVRADTKNPESDQIGPQIITEGSKDPRLLNNVAWTVLVEPSIKHRDLGFALKAARAAYEAAQDKPPSVQSAVADTYAKALYETGQIGEAVNMQKRALELCQDQVDLPLVKQALDFYQKRLLNLTNSPSLLTPVPGSSNK